MRLICFLRAQGQRGPHTPVHSPAFQHGRHVAHRYLPSLMLLDGVPVFDVNKIMAFNPLKTRELDVVDGHYCHGPLTYDGMVSYTAYKGDLGGFPYPPGAA